MSYTVIAYIVYLWVCIGLTLWVAHILFKNARVFFNDIFNKNEELALSVSHLLKAGFYLINIGLILFLLESTYTINNYKDLFEVVSVKTGGIILMLGIMHFINVYLLFKLRQKAAVPSERLALSTPGEHPYFGKSIDKELEEIKREENEK